MKIIGISSGLSYHGYTANLVRVALQAAANQGALVEEIFLPDYEIKICKGCYGCLAKGECTIDDDLELIRHKLSRADGIILGSQVFGMEPDPAMQNFFNRISLYSQFTSALADKYLLTIATTEIFGAREAARKLAGLTTGYFKKGYITGILDFNVSRAQIGRYPKYLGKTEHYAHKLVGDIKRKRQFQLIGLLEHFKNKLFRNQLIKKLVLAQKDGKMEAVYRELIARGWLADSAAESSRPNMNITAAVRS